MAKENNTTVEKRAGRKTGKKCEGMRGSIEETAKKTRDDKDNNTTRRRGREGERMERRSEKGENEKKIKG